MAGTGESDRKPRQPWVVFRRAGNQDPPNEVRYVSSVKSAIAIVLVAAFLSWLVFPARSIESDMREDVVAAKAQGYPQLPSEYSTDDHMKDYIEQWGLPLEDTLGTDAARERLVELSQRVADYHEDSSFPFLGLLAGLIAMLFLAAVAFSRAINNLYALGHEWSAIPSAWAAAGFLIPILNFILPWIVVDQLWRAAHASEGKAWRASRPSVVVAAWALIFIASAAVNPVTVSWFIGRGDIDGWISYLEWNGRAMAWLPVPVVFTALLVVLVTWWQHRRYLQLEAAGGAQPG